MKKLRILFFIGTVAVLASCTKTYEAKSVQLENMNDSLNYTLGLANGANIKSYYLRNDSSAQTVADFVEALDKAYASDSEEANSEMFELGKNIGSFLKQQSEEGLMGDSTLTFNQKQVMQGLINALNGYNKGMTGEEARTYVQKTIEQKRNQNPAGE